MDTRHCHTFTAGQPVNFSTNPLGCESCCCAGVRLVLSIQISLVLSRGRPTRSLIRWPNRKITPGTGRLFSCSLTLSGVNGRKMKQYIRFRKIIIIILNESGFEMHDKKTYVGTRREVHSIFGLKPCFACVTYKRVINLFEITRFLTVTFY